MIRHILSIVLLTIIMASCNNRGNNVASTASEKANSPLKVKFDSLISNPDKYMGQDIVVEGKVVHVCMESGKKLFIVGDNPDIRLYVAAGENIPKFPMDLLGSEISVEGVITRIGLPSSRPNEKEHSDKGRTEKGNATSGSNCETETAMDGQSSLANIMMLYRSHTVK
jgi:hypothetical protein